MENTQSNTSLKTILAVVGTLVACTAGTVNAQISQNSNTLNITGGDNLSHLSINSGFDLSKNLYDFDQDISIEGFRGGDLCGTQSLTQSTDPLLIGTESVWCGLDTTNDETSLGRSFIAPFDLTLDCITFGIRENIGGEAVVHVRVLVGSPSSAYSDLTLVSEHDVMIDNDTSFALINVDIPDAQIPAGSQFIIELNTPTRLPELGGDGGLLSFGTNMLGQNNPTYLRGPTCGAEDFTDVASFGFGNRHLVMSLGVDSGIASTFAGGFEMSLLGDGVMSVLGDDLVIAGGPIQGDFGVNIGYGDFTSGVGASFYVDSIPGEFATVTVGFVGPESTREFTFSEYQGDLSQAVLTLDSGDLRDELFDVHAYNDGELVGILEGQSSGSVVLLDYVPSHHGVCCYPSTIPAKGDRWGLIYEFKVMDSFGFSRDLDPSIEIDGVFVNVDSISLVFEVSNQDLSGGGATNLTLSVNDASGLTVNATESSPVVLIGEAETNPRSFGDSDISTQIGVPVRRRRRQGERGDGRLYATDMDADGVAELQIFAPLFSPGSDNTIAVDVMFGEVDSASIGIGFAADIPIPDDIDWWLCELDQPMLKLDFGNSSLPFGEQFDGLIGLKPKFMADEVVNNFTLQGYWNGQIVVEENGMSGSAGGTSEMPIRVGVSEGQIPGFITHYPPSTTFITADEQTFEIDEIRTISEGASRTTPFTGLTIEACNTSELILFDPITVLPSSNVCPVDFNDDGALNFFDISAFLTAFSALDPIADLNGDGAFNFFDVSELLSAFAAGCP